MQYFYITSLALLLFTCDGAGNHSIPQLSSDQVLDVLELNKVFSAPEIIRLSGYEDVVIGYVNKILVLSNSYVILHQQDPYSPKVVSVFTKGGLWQFDLKPDSTNFYLFNATDLTKSGDSSFELIESVTNKILQYSDKGRLIDAHPLPFKAKNFAKNLESKSYIFHKNYQALNHEDKTYFYNVLITDYEFNLLGKYFPFDIEVGAREILNIAFPLQSHAESVFFKAPLSDTLFQILDSSIISHVYYTTENNNLISDISSAGIPYSGQSNLVQEIINRGGLITAGNFFIDDKYESFTFVTAAGPGWAIRTRDSDIFYAGYTPMYKHILVPFPSGRDDDGSLYSVLNEPSLEYISDEYYYGSYVSEVIGSKEAFVIKLKAD